MDCEITASPQESLSALEGADLFTDRSREGDHFSPMTISHQTVLDKDGQPKAVIIPWNGFLEIRKLIDNQEPTQEELEACHSTNLKT